jgi:hypothetical protein
MRNLLVLIAVVALSTLGLQTPALAWPTTTYYVCSPYVGLDDPCRIGAASGLITWYNRTALVKDMSWDHFAAGYHGIFIEAYDGGTKIDTEEFYVDNEFNVGQVTATIGDTNRVGGFNRAKVWTCLYAFGGRTCKYKNYYKPQS